MPSVSRLKTSRGVAAQRLSHLRPPRATSPGSWPHPRPTGGLTAASALPAATAPTARDPDRPSGGRAADAPARPRAPGRMRSTPCPA
eukprot:1349889-Alexandrium_andersonii.AAC.1